MNAKPGQEKHTCSGPATNAEHGRGEKCALITGASGGMGSACAEELMKRGYTVIGLDRREPEAPGDIRFIRTDLTDPTSVERAYRSLLDMGLRPDCIVHLAGMYDMNSLAEMPEEEFLQVFRVNLVSVYRVNRLFLPLLQKGGRIIIITSELAPLRPLPFTGIYAVTKAALDKYAWSLSMELQLLGYHVSIIRPGAVKTQMLGDSVRALERFCAGTELYPGNAEKFRKIVNRVEAAHVTPQRLAALVGRVLSAKHPRQVYTLNRNGLLLLMNALPGGLQAKILRMLLK